MHEELTEKELAPLLQILETLPLNGETEEERFRDYIRTVFTNANRDYQLLRKLIFESIDETFDFLKKII